MLKKLVIRNYKLFDVFTLELNDTLNILVGNNEVGKSTVLEAINLLLTRRLNGRQLESEMTPYLFNKACAAAYVKSVADGKPLAPPAIVIELYLADTKELASLCGSMNSLKEDAVGVRLEIAFDEDYKDEYQSLIKDSPKEVRAVPVEYYRAHWRSFAGSEISPRALPIRSSYIDATTIRLQSGTDYYLQDIIRTSLDPKERVALSVAYRRLKEAFGMEPSLKDLNDKLTTKKGAITNKDLAIALDMSQRTSWDASLIPYLDELPFQSVGKGEQNALKIMLALERKAASDVVLVEEPENHLSFASMNILLSMIRDKCKGKQVIATTHSAYVLNKLGIGGLVLLRNNATARLTQLSPDTQDYFEKLSGYDTLRLVLAKRAILVEGPSDELIVQKAYFDKHGKLPIENGVDVISVGLSFLRFLEIAKELAIDVCVVTDNDGDCARVDKKYAAYKTASTVRICRSDDNSAPTLEPQMLKVNGLKDLNAALGKAFASDGELAAYMTENKTECALMLFRATGLKFPPYIRDAIDKE